MTGLWTSLLPLLFVCNPPYFLLELAVVLVAPTLRTLSDQETKSITEL